MTEVDLGNEEPDVTIDADSLFLSHPDPMWIYDIETLRFLAVNHSAVKKYGYSQTEFLAMTIADIRPEDDLPALKKKVTKITEGRDEAGIWRHRLKSGDIIHVDITGHTLEYNDRRAKLISARDVSRLVIAEITASEALEREKDARRSSDALARYSQRLFDSVPGMFIAYSADRFEVIAVSEAALTGLNATRPHVLGRNLLDVLPLQPDDPAHEAIQGSIDRILTTRTVDLMEVQRVLLPPPDAKHAAKIGYWAMSNTPIMAPDGHVLHLILRMQDLTDVIQNNLIDQAELSKILVLNAKADLVAHTSALKADNLRLAELAIRLRTTQRLLGTGTWEYLVDQDRMNWSDTVYEMYDVSPKTFGHGFEDYVELVHPEDRAEMRRNFASFMSSGRSQFTFGHRIQTSDGKVAYLRGLAEKTTIREGTLLSGAVQDVTQTIEAAKSLEHAKRMLEIAGTSAKFGAWCYDKASDRLEWSPQTARIHDEPEDFSPGLLKAIQYFIPEHQSKVESLLRDCIEEGIPFDVSLEIVSAAGKRKWVRLTGEAERADDGLIAAMQGSIQDVTELMLTRKRAEDSELLLDMAGRAVKLGGWRVSLGDGKVTWSDGVAAIHELPPGSTPSLDGGIYFFAPEEQEEARKVFESCALEGIPFDNVRSLITAKGNRIRVRSFGEPVWNEMGDIIAVQGAMQDVSELFSTRHQVDELTIRLAETLENIGDAFLTIDREWKFTYLNSRAEVLLRRNRNHLLGRKIFDEFPEARGSAFEVQYKRAFDTQETVRFEQFFPPLNRLFRISAHPTQIGLAVYFTDVTADRLRDEQLRLMGAAIGRINDVVIIADSGLNAPEDRHKIVYVNDAFERVTGFAPEEAIGRTPRFLQGPKTNRRELDRIKDALDKFEPVRAELITYTKSGKDHLQEVDIVPVANQDGVYTHFVATQRDISEKRQAEQALRTSETRFRLVARATGHAIYDWDLVSDRLWWSEEMTSVFGHDTDPSGSIPTVWKSNVHVEDLPELDRAMAQLLDGRITTRHAYYRFRRADGSWANVEDRAFSIIDEAGRVIRVLGSVSDISERLNVEERLRQSQKLEAVGQLTGGVAHDFNNLLTIIMGNAELLHDAIDEDSVVRPFAEMIGVAAERAAELTSRLLAFSRKQALQPKVVSLNSAISGLDGMLRRTLGESVDIKVVCASGLWEAEVDLGQLEAALLNLALNSRDAMPDGGVLTFETANVSLDESYVAGEQGLPPGQFVLIAVSDTGSGITAENMGRVFEPFFTTKAVGQGTGLGLSMVYGFVKQSGGHVRIYSELNEGTTIKMYFPRFMGVQEDSTPGSNLEDPICGNETILVVEDDPLILQQLSIQLEGLGYSVCSATSGLQALEILKERSDIDLLFTDVVLPGGMNGRKVADAAVELRPGLRVLYTSGYSANVIGHHGRIDPGVELLSKPYRRAELAAKLRKVLDPE